MIRNLAFGFLAVLAAPVVHASDRILPKACGSDALSFDIKTSKGPAQLAPPAEGMAKIVFIQTLVKKGFAPLYAKSDFTTRFGLDGAWAGAAGNNSYLTLDVAPGEHHVCASVQGSASAVKDMIGMSSFTAEAGKVYHFQFTAERISVASGEGGNYYSSSFDALKPDEGEFRVSASKLSESKPKH